MEAGVCKCGFRSLIVFYTNYNVSVFLCTCHESIEIFHVDVVFVQHLLSGGELTGGVADFYTDNFRDID